ncbi:S8 family serine peptidase [Flavisphingomonas formosensis]|uniref:S8 family serine peptidase n=1 Tax=Flavisphingomonas formosensis TaxID=861534 RepID=UPI0012F709E4|nr:S8 family serine peptidase [Sphingomonas formosensis]
MRTRLITALAIGTALLAATAGPAQLLPGGVTALPGQLAGGLLDRTGTAPLQGGVGGVVDTLGIDRIGAGLSPGSLLDLRRERLRALIRANRDVLEADDAGNPVRRSEIVAIDPPPAVMAAAKAAGFTVLASDRLDDLGITLVRLATPKRMSARDALVRLRTVAPDGRFELNHVFEPAGAALSPGSTPPAAAGTARGAPIGMIDGGVAAHPALAGAAIEQRGFVSDAPRASGHGTAIASLLVGADGAFRGAAVGRMLLVADIYGGRPAAGSADAIARAIGWMAGRGVRILSISLVGPADALVERAISAAQAKGMIVVAAVGNDGPAAPPLYPASYPGVIAVTGVDGSGRALIEAGRATHLDFAAPGSDMAAALPGRGYAPVRGTSFAAPLVAARFAAQTGDSAMRLAAVTAEAKPGRGRVGRGIVCAACRIDPGAVRAKK